jgi:hypothetical protein
MQYGNCFEELSVQFLVFLLQKLFLRILDLQGMEIMERFLDILPGGLPL